MYTIQHDAPVYSVTLFENILRVHASLAITCHLRFWQNDRDNLRATSVTQG